MMLVHFRRALVGLSIACLCGQGLAQTPSHSWFAPSPQPQMTTVNDHYPSNLQSAGEPPHVAGRVIVKLTETAALAVKRQSRGNKEAKAGVLKRLGDKFRLRNARGLRHRFNPNAGVAVPLAPRELSLIDQFYVFETNADNIPGLAKKLAADSDVLYAEPDYRYSTQLTPNDPFFSSSGSWNIALQDLWGLHAMDLGSAWDWATGEGIVVAVLDSGVSFATEELAPNRYLSSEIAGNGIDDDNNGFVDDVQGWNFVEDNNNPNDDNGHGTHVAGTIAAVFNNAVGIAGVAPNAKIMALRGLDTFGSGSTSDLMEAFIYAVDNGADIINNSWGGFGRSHVFGDMVAYALAHEVLPVFSAGNYSANTLFFTPAGEEGALTVAASDANANRAGFSNWGYEVDIAAPGVEILSLNVPGSYIDQQLPGNVVQGQYLHLNGTSMAAPHISGLAALLLEQDPTLSTAQLRSVLRETAQAWAPNQIVYSGPGIANAAAALNYVATGNQGADTHAFIQLPTHMSLVNAHQFEVQGSATGDGFHHYELLVAPQPAVATDTPNYSVVLSSTQPVDKGVLGIVSTAGLTPGDYTLQLRVYDDNGAANSHRMEFKVDAHLDEHWPKFHNRLYQLQGGVHDAVTGDLNGDGALEVVVFGEDKLYVYSGTGNLLPGFPVTLPALPAAGPTLADIDGDGDLEIALPTIRLDNARHILAYHHTGTPVAGFPAGTSGMSSGPYEIGTGREVLAADLDGNGSMELVSMSTLIHHPSGAARVELIALAGNGQAMPGYPVVLSDYLEFNSNVIAADINRDGRSELIAQFPDAGQSAHLQVYGNGGALLSASVLPAPHWVLGSVAYRDSASSDVLLGSSALVNSARRIIQHRISSSTFAISQDWSNAAFNDFYSVDLLVHDVNRDGHLDLLAQLWRDQTSNADLIAYNTDGSVVTGYPITQFYDTQRYAQAPAVVGNLAGVGDVFIASNLMAEVAITDMLGNNVAPSPFHVPAFQNQSQTVADIDADGQLEVIANNWGGSLYVWEIGAAGDMSHRWSVAQGNAQRTGFMERPTTATYPSMHLRGGFNGWASLAMTLVGDHQWQTTLWLTGASTQVKFDVYGNWATNFGDNNADGLAAANEGNIAISQGAGEYLIRFNDQTLQYSVEKLRRFAQVFARGTANNWEPTPMTLIANSTWQSTLSFGSAANQRFKFDINGDWSLNYGDNNGDGIAEQSGGDIFITQGAGDYVLTFNDQNFHYSVQRVGSVAVTFQCYNGYTAPGTSVYVVGNTPELGNWSIQSNAQKLSPNSYPLWSGTLSLAANTSLQWKCVKGNESSLAITQWQPGSNNVFSLGNEPVTLSAGF